MHIPPSQLLRDADSCLPLQGRASCRTPVDACNGNNKLYPGTLSEDLFLTYTAVYKMLSWKPMFAADNCQASEVHKLNTL